MSGDADKVLALQARLDLVKLLLSEDKAPPPADLARMSAQDLALYLARILTRYSEVADREYGVETKTRLPPPGIPVLLHGEEFGFAIDEIDPLTGTWKREDGVNRWWHLPKVELS